MFSSTSQSSLQPVTFLKIPHKYQHYLWEFEERKSLTSIHSWFPNSRQLICDMRNRSYYPDIFSYTDQYSCVVSSCFCLKWICDGLCTTCLPMNKVYKKTRIEMFFKGKYYLVQSNKWRRSRIVTRGQTSPGFKHWPGKCWSKILMNNIRTLDARWHSVLWKT